MISVLLEQLKVLSNPFVQMKESIMIKETTQEIKPHLQSYVKWTLCVMIDVVYLAIWGLFQYGLSRIISSLNLSGIDAWVFFILQVLSAISTLVPIALFIYRDIRVMWVRVNRDIQKEEQKPSEAS